MNNEQFDIDEYIPDNSIKNAMKFWNGMKYASMVCLGVLGCIGFCFIVAVVG